MSGKQRRARAALFAFIMLVLFVAILLTGHAGEKRETIKEVMRDAVLHETGRINFFNLNP